MPEPTTSKAEYDEMIVEHGAALAAVGSVAIASSEVEGAVADLLVVLVDAPLGGVFVYGLAWRSLYDTALALMKSIDSERARQVAIDLKLAAKLQERRNDIIHGRWAVNIEQPTRHMFVRSRRNRVPQYTQVTIDELHAVALDLYRVAISINTAAESWPD